MYQDNFLKHVNYETIHIRGDWLCQKCNEKRFYTAIILLIDTRSFLKEIGQNIDKELIDSN